MPSSRSVELAPEAEDDIEAIAFYTLANWGRDQSDRIVDDLFALFDRLAAFPDIGKRRERLLPGARSHPLGAYVVVYLAEPSVVRIVRVDSFTHGYRGSVRYRSMSVHFK